jgi:cell shape-determining protein MreC
MDSFLRFLKIEFILGVALFLGYLGFGSRISSDQFKRLELNQTASVHRTELDRCGEILRNFEQFEERQQEARREETNERIRNQQQADSARIDDLKKELEHERDKIDSEDRKKMIGGVLYSIVCGIPAMAIVIMVVFYGKGPSIPAETTNWAYATLGVIGTFWLGH